MRIGMPVHGWWKIDARRQIGDARSPEMILFDAAPKGTVRKICDNLFRLFANRFDTRNLGGEHSPPPSRSQVHRAAENLTAPVSPQPQAHSH